MACLQPALRREPELIDLPVGQLMLSIWQQMATKITVAGEAQPIELSQLPAGLHAHPANRISRREPELKPISEFRASLAHLKSLNVRTSSNCLMTGTLDLCSHRLDAWITSFATKRLARNAQDKSERQCCLAAMAG